jgi:hypothetical protein
MFGAFFILLLAAAIFHLAAELAIHGNVVAGDICLTGRMFCQHPDYLAVAAGSAGFFWLTLRWSGR